MDDPVPDEVVQGPISTEAQKRDHVIRLAFGGRLDRFDALLPRRPTTSCPTARPAILRRQRRHRLPLDRPARRSTGDGSGTERSGSHARRRGLRCCSSSRPGFFIPGVHSRPLSDDDPDNRARSRAAAPHADGESCGGR